MSKEVIGIPEGASKGNDIIELIIPWVPTEVSAPFRPLLTYLFKS